MKIPKEYGGLGMSVTNYGRVLGFIGGYCATTVAYLSAHQSIGVAATAQGVRHRGGGQKRKYLPRLAKERDLGIRRSPSPAMGSDPARMTTVGRLSEDGRHYILNGEQASGAPNVSGSQDTLIRGAGTHARQGAPNGKKAAADHCFVVETSWPGVERARRSRFMGLRGLANGVIAFNDVKVPVENMIGSRARASRSRSPRSTSARLGIPAAAIGGGMALVGGRQVVDSTRQQWGAPVGKHQAVAKMVSGVMAQLFAMKAMVQVACSFADHKNADIRLEAAAAKYWCSETLWKMYDDYLQVRGGPATSARSPCTLAVTGRRRSRWACAMRASTASSRARRR